MHLQAVFISAVLLLYMELLSESAALKCVADNLLYFGEPLALSMVGYMNSMIATCLWIWAIYGWRMGIVLMFAMGIVFFRMQSMYGHISAWHNPEMSEAARLSLLQWSKAAKKNIGQVEKNTVRKLITIDATSKPPPSSETSM